MEERVNRYYEFCGWLNTPDECAGEWFEDAPEVDAEGNPQKRVSYFDRARGGYYHGNWQVYFVEDLRDWTAHRITRFTVTPITVGEFRYGRPRPDVFERTYVSWEKKIVASFKCADGREITTR